MKKIKKKKVNNNRGISSEDVIVLHNNSSDEFNYESTFYDSFGKVTKTQTEDCCIVTFINKNKNKNIFKVKCDKLGKLYNPTKTGYKYNSSSLDNFKNKMFKFREVKYSVYFNYLKFLQNRNDSNLIIAEREMR
jgi:hypothetical protein